MRRFPRWWPAAAAVVILGFIAVFAALPAPQPGMSGSAPAPPPTTTASEEPTMTDEPTITAVTAAGFEDHRTAHLSLARETMSRHLPAPVVDAWLSLARPAVRLLPADGNHAPTLGRIGGKPDLPVEAEWPVGADGLPLDFLLQIDLAALAASGLDHSLHLPDHGLLLVFCAVDGNRFLDWTHPDVRDDTRLLHVTDAVHPRPVPEGIEETRGEDLTAVGILSLPAVWQPQFVTALENLEPDKGQLERASEDLGMETPDQSPAHQLGGWARPQQDSPELDYTRMWASDRAPEDWGPLLQVDHDLDRGWVFGDLGTLYWLTDLTAGDALERTGFVLQHG